MCEVSKGGCGDITKPLHHTQDRRVNYLIQRRIIILYFGHKLQPLQSTDRTSWLQKLRITSPQGLFLFSSMSFRLCNVPGTVPGAWSSPHNQSYGNLPWFDWKKLLFIQDRQVDISRRPAPYFLCRTEQVSRWTWSSSRSSQVLLTTWTCDTPWLIKAWFPHYWRSMRLETTTNISGTLSIFVFKQPIMTNWSQIYPFCCPTEHQAGKWEDLSNSTTCHSKKWTRFATFQQNFIVASGLELPGSKSFLTLDTDASYNACQWFLMLHQLDRAKHYRVIGPDCSTPPNRIMEWCIVSVQQ